MAIISLNKLKEIAEQNTQTHIVNLGKIDTRLKDIDIPIKVKSFEEILKIKNETKLTKEKLTIEYKPFSRLPKQLKEVIMNDDKFQNITQNTYIQLVKLDEDAGKLERLKFRERLFDILIHLDMEYIIDGKTMWQDAGINNKDYNKLLDLFSEIIQYESHLEILEVIIDTIRNGNYTDEEIDKNIYSYNFNKYLSSLSVEDRNAVIDSYLKAQDIVKNIEEKVENNNTVEEE